MDESLAKEYVNQQRVQVMPKDDIYTEVMVMCDEEEATIKGFIQWYNQRDVSSEVGRR